MCLLLSGCGTCVGAGVSVSASTSTSATTSASASASADVSVVCLDLNMHTLSECADTPGFVDAGGYECASNVDLDCWTGLLFFGWSEDEAMEVIHSCPDSCALCNNKKMQVNLIDVATGALPVFLTSSGDLLPTSDYIYTGTGPSYKSNPSKIKTQTFCVAEPTCLQVALEVDGDDSTQIQFTTRVGFEIINPETSTTIVSVSGSRGTIEFCLDDCESGTVYDRASEECARCGAGSFLDPVDPLLNSCKLCPRSTYSEGGNEGNECIPCPSHTPCSFSHEGSANLEQCMTLGGNIYASSQNKRVTKYNFDENTNSLVVGEDGVLDNPIDVAFMNNHLMLVSNYYANSIELYDINSVYKGILIEVNSPVGILMFPNGDDKVAVVSEGDKKVYVYDLTGAVTVDHNNGVETIVPRTTDDILSKESISSSHGSPRYLSFGTNMNEVLITTDGGKVLRRCINNACSDNSNSNSINTVMLYSNIDGVDLRGIATIPSLGEYLVADGWTGSSTVYRCSLTASPNQQMEDSCQVFTSDMHDPWAIIVDEVKQIVYVSEFTHGLIAMFDYQGTNLGNLGSGGDLNTPTGLAFRPGHYSPVSPIIRPTLPSTHSDHIPPTLLSTYTAGDPIEFQIILKDSYGNNITSANPVQPERFSAEFIGYIAVDGNAYETTFPGSVLQPDPWMQPHLLSAEATLVRAGNYEVNIMESGDAVPTHLRGSPFDIVVVAAETDALSCKSISPSSAAAGVEFEITIATFDQYNNPTDYEDEDKFVGWVGKTGGVDDAGVDAGTDAGADANITLSRVINPSASVVQYVYSYSGKETIARLIPVHVKHVNSDTEVANSPFFIQVAPGAANANSTSHNLKTNTLDTSNEVDFLLQVIFFYFLYLRYINVMFKIIFMKNIN